MNAAKQKAPAKAKQQQQLQLTYSVGDWVFVRVSWSSRARFLARVESATPIEGAAGDVWLVRCYYSPDRHMSIRGWAKHLEHRHVDCALNPAQIAEHRKAGIIPAAGSSVLP